jgi:hypothetical protein
MSQILRTIVVIGIDLGKNSFHVVGLDEDGAPVLRQKWSRGQVEARLANMPHVRKRACASSSVMFTSKRARVCLRSHDAG